MKKTKAEYQSIKKDEVKVPLLGGSAFDASFDEEGGGAYIPPTVVWARHHDADLPAAQSPVVDGDVPATIHNDNNAPAQYVNRNVAISSRGNDNNAPAQYVNRNIANAAGGNDNNAPAENGGRYIPPAIVDNGAPIREQPKGVATNAAGGRRIPVGFGKVAVAKNKEDSLVTNGLGNCIAIAAKDMESGIAVMGHFDTANCLADASKDAASCLSAFKCLLLNTLENEGANTQHIRFFISGGFAWHPDMKTQNALGTKESLLKACKEVFGCVPTQFAVLAEFSLDENKMRSGKEGNPGEADAIPPTPGPDDKDAGDEIPYDRLKQPNARGHKLDKNRNVLDMFSTWWG